MDIDSEWLIFSAHHAGRRAEREAAVNALQDSARFVKPGGVKPAASTFEERQ